MTRKNITAFILVCCFSLGFTGFAIRQDGYISIFSAVLFLAIVSAILLFAKYIIIAKKFGKQTATLSAVYKEIPDLLIFKDARYRYTSCNYGFEKFIGRTEAELINKTVFEVYASDPETAKKIYEADKKVITENARVTIEEWLKYPDGTERLMEIIKTPLTQNGVVTGVIGIARDITSHKATENQAWEASRSKSAFLAHMSHEIRTPMNTIVGMTELLLRSNIPRKAYENAMLIKHAGASMLSIINDILDFSKIEAGKLEIRNEEYLFDSLINDVISIIRMRIVETPVLFTANIDCNIPNKLIGDEIRLRQIFLNFLSNAVKYTNEGFISITASCEAQGDTVLLTVEVADSGIGIKEENIERLFEQFVQFDTHKNSSIQGTGLGLAIVKSLCEAMGGRISVSSKYGAGSVFTVVIPQKSADSEKLARVENPERKSVLVYEPRSIYAGSISRTFANLGVRCTLATSGAECYSKLSEDKYQFIFIPSFMFEPMKKKIEELDPDSKIVLMMEPEEAALRTNIRTIATPIHSVPVSNILNDSAENEYYYESGEKNILFVAPSARILIVDDVGTNLKVAEGLMAPYQMKTDLCRTGRDAVNMAKKNRYDIIFMDHMMPEMDGVEASAAIRASEDGSGYFENVPIIALTANAVSGMREIFLKNGLNDFLAKPIETAKLNNILEKWIPKEKRENYAEKTPQTESADIEIEGIDIESGLEMTGGAIDNYLKTLDIFRKDGYEKINEIRECLKNDDIKLYTVHIHALKSASMSVGARKISDFARTLEIAGKSEATVFIMENTEAFLTELDALLRNIGSALETVEAGERESGGNAAELPRNTLESLKTALDNMDAGEINNLLKQLEAKKWDKKTKEAIANLSQMILMFEYGDAVDIINAMLQ